MCVYLCCPTASLPLPSRHYPYPSPLHHLSSLLQVDVVTARYQAAKNRIFFFDYGGTLNTKPIAIQLRQHMGIHGRDIPVHLTEATRLALWALASDPANTIYIVSGKEKSVMKEAFSGMPAIGLAAEHGYYYCPGLTASTTGAVFTPLSNLARSPLPPSSAGASSGAALTATTATAGAGCCIALPSLWACACA